MSTVVLLSGGMDSVTALYHAAEEGAIAAALSFNYGSKHNAKEIPFAAHHAARFGVRHEIVDLTFMDRLFASDLLRSGGDIPEGHYAADNMKSTVVPFRNGIMISVAAGFAESLGAKSLTIAAHSGDHAIYPDCREAFMESMGAAVSAGTYEDVSLERPFIHMDKAAIAVRGAELGVDYAETWSCYKGREVHCGKCGTCVERREAFAVAKLQDPTHYSSRETV